MESCLEMMKASEKSIISQECNEKTGIDIFAAKAINAKESFSFSYGEYTYICSPIQSGKAMYIYGDYSSIETDFWRKPLNLKLWAIVRDNKIYLMNRFIFHDSAEKVEKLPLNIMDIFDYAIKWNKRRNEIINEYIKSIKENLDDIFLSESDREKCHEKVSQCLLPREDVINQISATLFSDTTTQDCLDHLSGYQDLEKTTRKVIEENIDDIKCQLLLTRSQELGGTGLVIKLQKVK